MKPTRILHDLGQSIWLDNITRDLLKTGWLRRYIDEFSVTGLTSNPTIFDHAIKNSGDYDDAIKSKLVAGVKPRVHHATRWRGGRVAARGARAAGADAAHRRSVAVCGGRPGRAGPLGSLPAGARGIGLVRWRQRAHRHT